MTKINIKSNINLRTQRVTRMTTNILTNIQGHFLSTQREIKPTKVKKLTFSTLKKLLKPEKFVTREMQIFSLVKEIKKLNKIYEYITKIIIKLEAEKIIKWQKIKTYISNPIITSMENIKKLPLSFYLDNFNHFYQLNKLLNTKVEHFAKIFLEISKLLDEIIDRGLDLADKKESLPAPILTVDTSHPYIITKIQEPISNYEVKEDSIIFKKNITKDVIIDYTKYLRNYQTIYKQQIKLNLLTIVFNKPTITELTHLTTSEYNLFMSYMKNFSTKKSMKH